MKKSLVGILAAAGFVAVGAIGAQGCSGSSGADGGGGTDLIQACAKDADCASYGGSLGGLCNVTAGVCMQKCSTINDCPSTDNTCGVFTASGVAGVTGTPTSGSVCSVGTGCAAPAVSNLFDGHCETACTPGAMSACTGYASTSPRTCNAAGQCLPEAVDGGPCAGVTCPIAGQMPDPTMACACTGGNTCTMTSDCQTGANVGDPCLSGTCTVDLCETPTYSYSPSAGAIVWGTTNNGTVSDTASGTPCESGGGMVNQWTTNVYFPAGDGPMSSSYMSVVAVKTSGAVAGNTYFAVNFTDSTFTWQECIGGSAATGTPAAIAVQDMNGAYSNNDCVTQ